MARRRSSGCPGTWIALVQERAPPDKLILDMDSSRSERSVIRGGKGSGCAERGQDRPPQDGKGKIGRPKRSNRWIHSERDDSRLD